MKLIERQMLCLSPKFIRAFQDGYKAAQKGLPPMWHDTDSVYEIGFNSGHAAATDYAAP